MIAIPIKNKRISWIIALFLIAIAMGYFGWVYSIVRGVDQLRLVHIALFDGNELAARVADFEVKRRIKNGSENGVDALDYVLGFVDIEFPDNAEVFKYAESLLILGVEINGYSSRGVTALHNAIFLNRPNAVRFLLEHCADPSAPTSTYTDAIQQKNAIELTYWADKIAGGRQNFDEVFDLLVGLYPQCSI